MFSGFNPDLTPLAEIYSTCLELEATTDAQEQVQEQCVQGLNVLLQLEMSYMLGEAEGFPSDEA